MSPYTPGTPPCRARQVLRGLTAFASRTVAQPGFTLLELLVVLVIITVLSGMVMVAVWPALDAARLRSGARTVIAALRYARSHAVSQQVETTVVFDTLRRGVYVQLLTAEEEEPHVLSTQAGRFRALPEGVTYKAIFRPEENEETLPEQVTVTFSVIGEAEDVSIVLGDERGHQRVLQVDAITGQVEIEDDAS